MKKPTVINRLELDSHADTVCAGANMHIEEYLDEVVIVSAYTDEYPTKKIPIVTALTAYTLPDTGETVILRLYQCLGFGDDLPHSLLSVNQVRAFGLRVEDAPRHFLGHQDSSHSIVGPDDTHFPLELDGTVSYLETTYPTEEERHTCRYIDLTSDAPWDPHSSDFAKNEERARDRKPPPTHKIDSISTMGRDFRTVCDVTTSLRQIDPILTGDFRHLWNDTISAVTTRNKECRIDAETLARRWCIGLATAQRTLEVTTQSGLRLVSNPLTRRLRTSQQHLRYNILKAQFYSDTMFSTEKSLRGMKAAQVFTTDFDFTWVKPLKSKRDAGYTLDRFVQDVGIPYKLLTDGAPELIDGTFGAAIKRLHINHTVSEPYSPWQNRAEMAIRELKKTTLRTMVRGKVPKRLWDYCLSWSAEIRTFAAHSNPALEGQLPYEILHGETPDISEHIEFDFYQRIWYIDPSDFPNERTRLGRWLGVAHCVGQPLCY